MGSTADGMFSLRQRVEARRALEGGGHFDKVMSMEQTRWHYLRPVQSRADRAVTRFAKLPRHSENRSLCSLKIVGH